MSLPWVRFFPSDWLAGTRGLSAVETGVYISLIAMMYERAEPLQEDHARLARLCGASNSAFGKALDALIEQKKIVRKDGALWNDRVGKEQVYLSEKSEVGKRAANSRWQKAQQKQEPANADAMHTQSVGNANQKPDTRSQKEALPSGGRARAKGIPLPLPENWEPSEADIAYAAGLGHSRPKALDIGEDLRVWARANDIRKVSWPATYQGFCRTDAKRQKSTGPPGHRPSASAKNGLTAIARQIHGIPDERPDDPEPPPHPGPTLDLRPREASKPWLS